MGGEPDPHGDPLAPAAARLTARYGGIVDPDAIRLALHEAYQALLVDATVTAFLPLLAERSAAARLAHTTDDHRPGPPPPRRPVGPVGLGP